MDCRDHPDAILDSISNMGEMASVDTNAALYEVTRPRSCRSPPHSGFTPAARCCWTRVMRGFRQESQPLSACSQRRLPTLASVTVRRIVAANETSANRLVGGMPSAREMQCLTIVVAVKSTASMAH